MNLADLYSTLETIRRNGKGLLSNPTDTLAQWGNQIKEDLGQYDQGNARAMGLLSAGNPSAAADAALQNNKGIGTGLGLLGLHIAYHGTPHVVDKFDMSKVGTGEGAQAYGHGLYFAENPSVAKNYANPGRKQFVEGLDPARYGMSAEDATHIANNWLAYQRINPTELHHFRAQNATGADLIVNDILDGRLKGTDAGNLYKVDINADPAHYLDWDKPLSQQSPQVQAALQTLPQDVLRKATGGYDQFPGRVRYDATTGSHVYSMLGGGPDASQVLKQAGIPGIKYKDAGSRSGDGGTHNFVVFDDSLINNLGPQP